MLFLKILFVLICVLIGVAAIVAATITFIFEREAVKEIKKDPNQVLYARWTKLDDDNCQAFYIKFKKSHPLSKEGEISIQNFRTSVEIRLRKAGVFMKESEVPLEFQE